MVSTFQAFAVFVIALLPGASYTFAYERRAGSFGITLSDRVFRFLAASAVFQALLAGPAIVAYHDFVTNGRLQHGKVNAWAVEAIALLYVLLPSVAGNLVGAGQQKPGKRWAWARWLATDAPEPRAWDHLWRRQPSAVVRIKLRSGRRMAGLYGTVNGRRGKTAAGASATSWCVHRYVTLLQARWV